MPHSLYESLYLSATAASVQTALWVSVCLSLTLTTLTAELLHVFLHGAASAHPQSPRIGRTLLSSLGELTGGAGLQRQVSAFDSCTAWSGKELQGMGGALDVIVAIMMESSLYTFLLQVSFYYVKQKVCSVTNKQSNVTAKPHTHEWTRLKAENQYEALCPLIWWLGLRFFGLFWQNYWRCDGINNRFLFTPSAPEMWILNIWSLIPRRTIHLPVYLCISFKKCKYYKSNKMSMYWSLYKLWL